MANDTAGKTFLVAFILCAVCSVVVSAAAVVLKPAQSANRLLDKKRNILAAAGLLDSGSGIDQLFEQIESKVVDLATGAYVDGVDAVTFDFVAAANSKDQGVAIPLDRDRAGIKHRSRYLPVYLVRRDGAVSKVVLPVYGKGLWSTLYGFIAIDRADLNTIRSLVYYEHAETPGLGGEVENPRWKAMWNGKKAFGSDGAVNIQVVHGTVDPAKEGAQHQVDGLSGATITSRGVQMMLHYWLGPDGYGTYLDGLRREGGA